MYCRYEKRLRTVYKGAHAEGTALLCPSAFLKPLTTGRILIKFRMNIILTFQWVTTKSCC
jgi:hypothetical protein